MFLKLTSLGPLTVSMSLFISGLLETLIYGFFLLKLTYGSRLMTFSPVPVYSIKKH